MHDSIIQALTAQVACYRRLAKLAEAQHEHVQNGQTDSLLEVLQRRQALVDELTACERVIAPAKQDWSSYTSGLAQDAKSLAEQLMNETRTLLAQITAADRDDVMVLQQQKINVGRKLQQTSSARQINRTYAAAAYSKAPARMDVQR